MFDPRYRQSDEEISREADSIIHSPVFSLMIEDIPNMIIIMNSRRQIIYSNKKFNEVVSQSRDDTISRRPGECLMCVHAASNEYGCGSTEFCKVCGLAKSIKRSEKGSRSTGECNITLDHGDTLTFRVHTIPFDHQDNRYVFAYMEDISDYKTRQMLENIFLHDINNSVTALNGLNEMINDLPQKEVKSIINDLSLRLTDEIHSYRVVTEAENHSLSISVSEVDIDELLENVVRSLLSIRSLRNRRINLKKSGCTIFTDETLLRRVMINAIKNALEASSDEEEIRIFTRNDGEPGLYQISVKSIPLIPRHVQMQLFQRAFSTKGTGRGWGTYSIRLLTERYLGGKVEFVSNPKRRTVFTISIPSLTHYREL
jgi:nitrogen-specific signal transduction histidine kinase